MTDQVNDGRRADLKDGGGGRRDYGPKGACGPMVYAALITVLYVTQLRKSVRR